MHIIPIDHTPIIKMLSSCLEKEIVSFHMPGHTNGKSFPTWLAKNALAIDTTELDTTDDLHDPKGAAKDAFTLAADAFGAKETFFVTTGSTSSLHAALLATTKPGTKIIMTRNVHKSVMNACIMFDLIPIFSSENDLISVIAENIDAKIVLLTRPDYYGNCMPLDEISKITHETEKLLIIDEAHGTHFAFCPSLLPASALSLGADIVIQSAHKTVPSLTQGSYIHISKDAVCNNRITSSAIKDALSIISTSSPSFLIAATLDYARAYLAEYAKDDSIKLFGHIEYFYSLLLPQWKNSFSRVYKPGYSYDPFRIVINASKMNFSAGEIVRFLSSQGIIIEFYDTDRVILICKFDNEKKDFILLANALNDFYKQHYYNDTNCNKTTSVNENCNEISSEDTYKSWNENIHNIPKRIYNPYCAMIMKDEFFSVPLNEACDKIIAEALIPYPPGVPLIWPGEILSSDLFYYIFKLINNGISIKGIDFINDDLLNTNTPYIKCLK